MALEPLTLDDLTWSGMTAAIRQRIAPASGGLWTLHAAVDPGVTMLELFAWLLEQRLFWLDQTPDEMTRGALALLGLEPKAAQAAGTALRIQVPPGSLGSPETPKQTDFALNSPGSTLVFTTLRDLTLLPVSAVTVSAGGRDVTTDLTASRLVERFTSAASDLTMEFPMSVPPGAGYAGLLVALKTSGRVAPQWAAWGRFAPDAATVVWQYTGPGGSWKSFDPGTLHDGTAGFRRSGVVRFAIPNDWTAPRRMRASVADGAFAAPPRLAAVVPNVEIARNRRVAKFAMRPDWLPLPGNQIDLSDKPQNSVLKDLPVLARSICVQLREHDGQWRRWTYRADFAGAGPADRVFTFDRDRTTMVFGNGIAGRIPVLSASPGDNARLAYHAGGGAAGNLAQDGGWVSRLRDANGAPLWTATNPETAAGGTDEEALTTARSRAGAFVRQGNRAILQKDFEDLAIGAPNLAIARAHAAVGYHPCYPCDRVPGAVTVFIVPEVPRPERDDEDLDFTFTGAPVPDRGQLAAVAARLEAGRLVGTEIYVRPPIYRPVAVALEASAASSRFDELKQRLFRAIRHALDPLGGIASGLATAYAFGEPVRPTWLRRVAQDALGRDGDVLRVLVGLDGQEPADVCGDITIGPHDLVYLTSFDLTIKPAQVRRGGLR